MCSPTIIGALCIGIEDVVSMNIDKSNPSPPPIIALPLSSALLLVPAVERSVDDISTVEDIYRKLPKPQAIM